MHVGQNNYIVDFIHGSTTGNRLDNLQCLITRVTFLFERYFILQRFIYYLFFDNANDHSKAKLQTIEINFRLDCDFSNNVLAALHNLKTKKQTHTLQNTLNNSVQCRMITF